MVHDVDCTPFHHLTRQVDIPLWENAPIWLWFIRHLCLVLFLPPHLIVILVHPSCSFQTQEHMCSHSIIQPVELCTTIDHNLYLLSHRTKPFSRVAENTSSYDVKHSMSDEAI
jgi:hypothetical protein